MSKEFKIGLVLSLGALLFIVLSIPPYMKRIKAKDAGVTVQTIEYFEKEMARVKESTFLSEPFLAYRQNHLDLSDRKAFRNFSYYHFLRGLGYLETGPLESSIQLLLNFVKFVDLKVCSRFSRNVADPEEIMMSVSLLNEPSRDLFMKVYFDSAEASIKQPSSLPPSDQSIGNAWTRASQKMSRYELMQLKSSLLKMKNLNDEGACSTMKEFFTSALKMDASSRMTLINWYFGSDAQLR